MSRMKLAGFAYTGLSAVACVAALAQAPPKSEAPAAKEGVAATIGGKPVTLQELDAKALKTNMKLAQSLYDARRAALDQVLMDRLLGEEATAQKITVDDLISKKVAEKVKPVTDAEVEAFYNAQKARMGTQTLEQASANIRNQLMSQKQNQARADLLGELKQKAEVKVMIEPPRAEVAIAPNAPTKGPASAKVTVIEFSDFQ